MDVALPTRSTKGHLTTALVRDHWYIACRSSELRAAPLARTIVGTPMVLFRAEDGRAAALLDRCAHRNVPLSLGYTEGARLVCRYHGWEFDGDGHCQRVPALCGEQTGKARRVPRFATIERQGFVWVYATPDVAPKVEAPLFPKLDDPRYSSVRFEAVFEAGLHATVENILDVPHTAFLHRGLFRGVKKNEITAIVRRRPGIVEAEYVGEPRPTGVLGSILAPQGGTVQHFDRFVLPSIAQVEYALGDRNHVLITNALTPESELVTRLHAVATFRVIVPHFLLKLALVPIAKRVVAQDAEILKAQTEAVKRFGGEQYASTDVDLLGPHILRMLKAAERGEPIDETVETLDEVRLLA
ncbi:aromatic ring-hydroxylating dioxygenase subunit alpha [Myxococcota bacterium]|nr:aromatic ring-hydroxylating dioxygenase subunit alpha [Myxococcota bacterium]